MHELLLNAVLLLSLLVVCSFLPGFYFLRRLRWSPLEKLCGAIGLSLILLYLVSTAFYWLDVPGPAACWAVSAICLALGILARRDLVRLVSWRQARRVFSAFAFLLLWTLALLGMIRNYSGGPWSGDWVEHFQRTLFLLHHFPKDTPIYGGYQFPARPPMMNLLAAFFLSQTGDRFELFQLTSAFLNLLVFFPCCLLSPALWRRSRRRVWLLAALFALNPMITENTTYTWTKLLATFYVVLALWFYLTGWRKNDRLRMTAAFVALAAGILVHYSAGPYLVFLALHYLIFLFRRRRQRWRELASAVGVGGVLLASWFTWSIAVYGARSTFLSNTHVTALAKAEGNNATKIAANLFDTIIPYPLRSDAPVELLEQPREGGRLRDSAFLVYQTNVIFAMGAIGGPVVLYLLYLAWRRRRSQEQTFWVMLVPFCLLLGVAVHGARETFGLAQVTLQPLVALGLSLLAAGFASLRRVAGILLLAGCTIDFALGVFLQARVENGKNTAGQTVFTDQPAQLSAFAWLNWFQKHQLAACGAAQLQECLARDQLYFGGWYARNHGQMVFLGDWAGDWSTVAVLLMFIPWAAVLLDARPIKAFGKAP
jgi:4-amino-4-deoxy-L-arabinose transferase-like glycosyltransferase